MYPSAQYATTEHKHRGTAPVVRAKRRILLHRAAKFRHHNHCGRRHPRTQIFAKRRQPVRQFSREPLNLSLLCKVGIPARQIDRRRFQPDVRLDQPRQLTQPV